MKECEKCAASAGITEKFQFSFNWFAAIFQSLWYIAKGIWPKFLLYGSIVLALNRILASLELFTVSSWLWLPAAIFFGSMANYDYYLHKKKGEPFWPKIPYKKFKVPFWTAVSAFVFYIWIFSGFVYIKDVGLYARNARPGVIRTFTDESMSFDSIPEQWIVYSKPPARFPVKLSRPIKQGLSESLKFWAQPGTEFIGYIVEAAGKARTDKGLVSLISSKQSFIFNFKTVEDTSLIKKARSILGPRDKAFYKKWFERAMTVKNMPVKYMEFSGHKWGRLSNEVEMSFHGEKTRFYIDIYWTIAGGKAVYVLSQAFEPYKDDVSKQVERFLGSFNVKG